MAEPRLAIAASPSVRPSGMYGEGARQIYDDSRRQIPGMGALPSATCMAIKNDGEPCGAKPAKDTPYCAGHLRQQGSL